MQQQLRGADIVARTLARAGVEHIFSLSGNHIMSVYDASIEAKLRILHVRHEAAAVHMADAWSRLTGRTGVALLTGGPGHANGLSALYTALASESAMLLLSGHAPTGQLGRGAFQEMRQADMAAPVTKASWMVTDVNDLAADLAKAVRIANKGRPGPVHLSLPDDILNQFVADATLPDEAAFTEPARPLPGSAASEFAGLLLEAQRPLILTGPVAATARAGQLAENLEGVTGIPVITMESPRGTNDPALGALVDVLSEADCVLLLGKQPDFTLGFCRPPVLPRACRVLQIDPEPMPLMQLQKSASDLDKLPLQFRADTSTAARALIRAFNKPHANEGWRETVHQTIAYRPPEWREAVGSIPGALHPAEVCAQVQPFLDDHPHAVLVCDGGEFGQWAQACLHAPRRLINGPAGAIGSAPAFAMAASLVFPDAPIVALMGDGTVGFHIAEFDTAVRENLPFIAVVGNDACWNAEYQIQLRSYGADRAVGCELLPTRYDEVATALGAHGEFVDQVDAVGSAMRRAHASGRSACVNVSLERIPAPVIRRSSA